MYQLFIFFMITDPKTTVKTRWGQCLVAFLVAAVEMVPAAKAATFTRPIRAKRLWKWWRTLWRFGGHRAGRFLADRAWKVMWPDIWTRI